MTVWFFISDLHAVWEQFQGAVLGRGPMLLISHLLSILSGLLKKYTNIMPNVPDIVCPL